MLSLWWWIIYWNDQVLIGTTGKIHSLQGTVIRTHAGNMGNPTLSSILQQAKTILQSSASQVHVKTAGKYIFQLNFLGFLYLWIICWPFISPWCLKGFEFFLHLMVGKIQSKSCHWGLTSFRYLGSYLFREPAKLLNFGRKSGNF